MKTGRLPENVLKRSVYNQLHTKNPHVVGGVSVETDCAFLRFPGSGDMPTFAASSVSGSVTLRKNFGNTEDFRLTMPLLVGYCVNQLAAGGAKPAAVTVTFLLREETENEELRHFAAETEEICGAFGMQITGVHGRVFPGICETIAVVEGYGSILCNPENRHKAGSKDRDTDENQKTEENAQDIVISKWIGLQGSAYLALRNREGLNGRYPAYLVENASHFTDFYSVVEEAEIAAKCGAKVMLPSGEGGIFAALWDFSEKLGCGFEIDQKKIPLRQETVEICEFCGVNPYQLWAGGCLVIAAEKGEDLVQRLTENGIPAVVVGKTTDQKAKLLRNEDEIRYLDRPGQDEVYIFSMRK